MWLEIYKNQGPYLLKNAWKLQLVGFFEKFYCLNLLKILLNESSSNFCFLTASPPRINSEKFLILIYSQPTNQNQMVMVRHAQLCLDQSYSKLLETPITQETSKLLYWFLHIWKITLWISKSKYFFQDYVRASSKCLKIMFQRLKAWFFAYYFCYYCYYYCYYYYFYYCYLFNFGQNTYKW